MQVLEKKVILTVEEVATACQHYIATRGIYPIPHGALVKTCFVTASDRLARVEVEICNEVPDSI